MYTVDTSIHRHVRAPILIREYIKIISNLQKNNKKDRGYKDIICLLQMWYNYLLFLLLGNFAHNISEKEKKN